MSAPKIALLGEVLFDSFADGVQILGGAPFNVAWHLQAFQQQVFFMSRIAQDAAGEEVLSAMQSWGMNVDGIQRDSHHPTGRVEISLVEGEPHYSILEHQAYDYIDFAGLAQPHSQWLYHGSLAFLQWRKNFLGKVFVDINLRSPWWNLEQLASLLKGADWLKLNQDELLQLNPEGLSTQEQLQSIMARYGLSAIILTQGAEGACMQTFKGEFLAVKPQQQSNITDTVGAGDAFAAVCLLGLIHEWPLGLMLERAQAFASALLAQRGAIVRQTDFYQNFIRQWQLSVINP